MRSIRTSKDRNKIPLSTVADFPYDRVEITIRYFTKDHVWISVEKDGYYKISRPKRYFWAGINICDKVFLEKKRTKRSGTR